MAYKGFTALFPLITTSYVSHVLLPAGVGRVSYANTIAAYFVLIALWDCQAMGSRRLHRVMSIKNREAGLF